ncbi:MAG: DUF3299 domain-containing protein [Alphaproteobacteria bacterium]
MRVKYSQIIVIIGVFILISGFSISQPTDERNVQDALPKSQDKMWDVFFKCKVTLLDNIKYVYSIDYTPEVKEMEGMQIEISGFVLPLEPTEKFTHFLLSKRTPTCFFCPPGEPNELIEVFTKKPIAWEDKLTKVQGILEFSKNPEKGLFFQMRDAEIIK